ncbi:hypothetical protein [Kiloniella litopenaei]|uniref:hypothetical protein n=1 Tax=Kiloniella litopenaei TaxID=1549748 RepID=UPI003BAC30B1
MVSQIPPEQAVHDIPVKTVSGLAIKTVMGNLPALMQMALFPFLLSALITALSIQFIGNATLSLLFALLSYIPHTLFAVAWHRRTLLNKEHLEPTSIISWNQNHTQFLFQVIILLAIYFSVDLFGNIPSTILHSVSPPLGAISSLILFIVTLYVIARVSFVLPASSVGEKYSIKDSWKHTEKQGWRLLGAFLLLFIPLSIAIFLIIGLIGGMFLPELILPPEANQTPELLSQLLTNYFDNNLEGILLLLIIFLALSYIPTAAVISMLSIAFKGCTGWVPEQSEEKINS